mgnify:CR=1 FL=1
MFEKIVLLFDMRFAKKNLIFLKNIEEHKGVLHFYQFC